MRVVVHATFGSRAMLLATEPPGAPTPWPLPSRRPDLFPPASRSGLRPSAGGAGGSTAAASVPLAASSGSTF
eukprot:15443190-Alexandrium_andersonii.AAC.1